MARWKQRSAWLLLIMTAVFGHGGCRRRPLFSLPAALPGASDTARETALTFERGQWNFAQVAASLNATQAREEPFDLIWAMGECGCAENFGMQRLSSSALRRGVLPQVLVPAVRNEIRNNEKLKLADTLTSSLAHDLDVPSGLTQILLNSFLTDDTIDSNIKASLSEKIANALPGSLPLPQSAFRFDALYSSSGDASMFVFSEQLARWNLVWALPALWQTDSSFGTARSLQLLEAMREMSEWVYLFGLEKSSDGKIYGGLTLATDLGATLLPYDPRTAQGPGRFVSGAYRISVPHLPAVDLAKSAQEQWVWSPARVSLFEQATFWITGAKAFHRLRPGQRGKVLSLFGGDKGIFPDNAHFLGLIPLSSMDTLLNGPFIDENRRLIRQFLQSDEKADLASLVRLLHGLELWRAELVDLSDAHLGKDIETRLQTAPRSLLRAIQLISQTILMDHIHARDAAKSSEISLWSRNDFKQEASLAVAGEALSTLIDVEQNVLHSPFLRQKIDALMRWFLTRKLPNATSLAAKDSASPDGLTAEGTLWAYTAMQKYVRYFGTREQPAWVQAPLEELGRIVAAWDRGYAQ